MSASPVVAVSEPNRGPDRNWWLRLLTVIDSRDAAAFGEFLTPDATFRFGNAAPVVGADAIRDAVAGFFSSIRGCRHRLIRTWGGEDGVACEGEVTYTRHDGGTVTVPFVNVFEMRVGRIHSYSIYIDNSPLFAAAG
jgi:ketosteroid isomerase-like protein